MSEATLIEPVRLLRSPFNGEVWKVPSEVSEEMYEALVARGFTPVQPKKGTRDRG
jgi:hypothetical protein